MSLSFKGIRDKSTQCAHHDRLGVCEMPRCLIVPGHHGTFWSFETTI